MHERSNEVNWVLFVDRIVEHPWLDKGADAVKGAVHKFYKAMGPAAVPVRNFLYGVWLGHPLHPVITDIVVGSYTSTALLDVAEAAGAEESIAPATDIVLTTGIVSGLAAAVAGITDWHVLKGKPKRIGFLHMLFNLSATTLYIGSLIARKSGNRGLGRALAWTAYGTIFGGAYLGGNLVFTKNIGVDHSAEWEQTDEYRQIMAEADLRAGELRKVMLHETPVVLIRQGRSITAMGDLCAHEGCSLAETGEVEDGSIRCRCHGSRYRLADGIVLEGPSAHPQPVYDVRIRGGQIEVRQPSE
jgi:nitrite reductase/ring-hydroxylating ferredoxin subunit